MTIFLDALAEHLHAAGAYAKDDQVAPAAILWPDEERQWEPFIPRLRGLLPLFTLGTYETEAGIGPAAWLRCVVDRALPDDSAFVPEGEVPVLYLPGLGKEDVRAVEEAPPLFQPLAELQYRGTLFTQNNGRDWPIPAFLQSDDGGLGIDTGADGRTKEPILGARLRLADIPIAELEREAQASGALRALYFFQLVDPGVERSLLEWLSDPIRFEAETAPEQLAAFRGQCRDIYRIDPLEVGPISIAQELGLGQSDGWEQVWSLFADAPQKSAFLGS